MNEHTNFVFVLKTEPVLGGGEGRGAGERKDARC